MIIWIDGTYGVGKTTVASELMERFSNSEAEFLQSDRYRQEMWDEMVAESKRTNCMPDFGGFCPQNNIKFLEKMKGIIKERASISAKYVIFDMAVTMIECKEKLFDPLLSDGNDIIHIILIADEEIIKSRIENDNNRDKVFALNNLKNNLIFLNSNFNDAIRIKTNNRSVGDIVDEIIGIINSQQNKMAELKDAKVDSKCRVDIECHSKIQRQKLIHVINIENFIVFNIREHLQDGEIGETELNQLLSDFSCPINLDVERFLKRSTIEFTKKNQSVTYNVFSNNAVKVGYFSITIKPITVSADNFSNIMKRKNARVSEWNEETQMFGLSAYLIT